MSSVTRIIQQGSPLEVYMDVGLMVSLYVVVRCLKNRLTVNKVEHDFVPVEYSANQLFHLVFVIVDERGHCEVEKYMIFASLFFVRKFFDP